MSEEEYSLECDNISFVSSLSNDDLFFEPQMYDLLSIEEHSSAGKHESTCRIELEEMIESFNDNHRSIAHLRSFGTLTLVSGQSSSTLEIFTTFGLSNAEFTFETIQTDDVSIPAPIAGDERISFKVHHDEKSDEAFEDLGSHIDDAPSSKMLSAQSRRSSFDQTKSNSGSSQVKKNGPLTTYTTSKGLISSGVGSNACFAENELIQRARARRLEVVNKRPVTRYTSSNGNISSGVGSNACFAENERIQRARARRFEALKRYESVLKHTSTFEALKRYEDVLKQTSTLNVDHHNSSQHEESLNKQVTENIDPTSSFQKTPSGTRPACINELRSRQRKSLKELIGAFDKVRRNTIATTTTTTTTTTRSRQPPRTRLSWSMNPWGRWNKR